VAAETVIYLLHGEDEYAIAQALAELENKLGDPATAAMNTSRLDGSSYNLDGLLSVAGAMPFLAKRRLVILSNVHARLNTPTLHKKFLAQLDKIPPTTAFVLVEHRPLTSDRDRKKNQLNWLEKWALEQGERVYLKAYPLPKGPDLARRIQETARKAGGQLTFEAAQLLVELVDGDPRLADQEVQKLLAYVNYQRPVEHDDVQALTADVGQGDIFTLVDALGNRDGRRAQSMLHRLLEYQDYYSIFGMVVRQFRLLIQAREVIDRGGGREEIIRVLKLFGTPFIADKLIPQARRFSMADLERIYHRLLEIDQAVKTSQSSGELALDTLVASLTLTPDLPRPGR
jgi:DNA polymerase-3 subunit delta